MDPAIGSIIVAIIVGIFSIVTMKIQKNQNALIKKIDDQNVLIEKEKEVRQRLVQAEKKRDLIIEQMTIVTMKINIHLINALSQADPRIVDDLRATAKELETSYKAASNTVKEVAKEYEILIDVASEVQKEWDRLNIARKPRK